MTVQKNSQRKLASAKNKKNCELANNPSANYNMFTTMDVSTLIGNNTVTMDTDRF